MKANAPKRKVFQDAVDLLTGCEPAETGSGNHVQMLPVENIRPFHSHPFRLYEGERLKDMADSVREHGILNPVIVQKTADGYEMLAGHNRLNAAKLAGIASIPAVVKENLTEQEAYVYVIETNMLQRSFSELSVSEKAAVLAERYDKVMSQGKRNDIIRELEEMAGGTVTCGHDDHKSKSRDSIGKEYGLSGSTVARMLRVNYLIPEIKNQLDAGKMNLMTAVQLSYVPEEIQRTAAEIGKPISRDMAASLREEGITSDDVRNIICRAKSAGVKKAEKNVKLPASVYEKFFRKEDSGKVAEIIEAALEAWFAGREDTDIHGKSAGSA